MNAVKYSDAILSATTTWNKMARTRKTHTWSILTFFSWFRSSSHYVDNIFIFFFQDCWGRPCTTWCYSTLTLFDGELRYTTTLSLKVLIQVGCVCRVRPRRPSTRRPHFRSHSYEDDDVRVPDRRRRSPLFSLMPLHYIFGSYFRETFEKWRQSDFLRKSTFNAKFV